MATIKSYSDLEQSRKLAEILPIESADMWHRGFFTPSRMCKIEYNPPAPYHSVTPQWDCPCWSLVALLGVLPYPQLSKDKLGSGKEGWMVSIYPNNCRYDSCWHDNPIDACYEMVIRLNELNLL